MLTRTPSPFPPTVADERRLDRVDCLVIDASLLSHARFSVASIHV